MNETTGAIDGRGTIDLGSGIAAGGRGQRFLDLQRPDHRHGHAVQVRHRHLDPYGRQHLLRHTTVSAGTLVVNGSQPQSPVTVNGTATLMGDGVIGDLQVFGSVRPGSSPGILTCSNVNFAAQGDLLRRVERLDARRGLRSIECPRHEPARRFHACTSRWAPASLPLKASA